MWEIRGSYEPKLAMAHLLCPFGEDPCHGHAVLAAEKGPKLVAITAAMVWEPLFAAGEIRHAFSRRLATPVETPMPFAYGLPC